MADGRRLPSYLGEHYSMFSFFSETLRDHLLMGPAYGLDASAGKKMSGFVANPMEKAEASKIAIFGVADYAWPGFLRNKQFPMSMQMPRPVSDKLRCM